VPNVHDLRHTFAALAASAGFSIFEVSRMMGHESITTTANRYGHLFPDRRHEAHDRMEEMLREAGAARAVAMDAEVVAIRP
jgi:integrase